jgi:hypothetical protein
LAKKCPTSVVATVFIVGSWIMKFYYWHLTAEIWHLAAFTLLTCFVLPFTLPGCCCNGFLVMKSVREGKGSTPTDTSRFLTKVKASLKKDYRTRQFSLKALYLHLKSFSWKKCSLVVTKWNPQFLAWEQATFQKVLLEFQGLMLCSRGGHVVYLFTRE